MSIKITFCHFNYLVTTYIGKNDFENIKLKTVEPDTHKNDLIKKKNVFFIEGIQYFNVELI